MTMGRILTIVIRKFEAGLLVVRKKIWDYLPMLGKIYIIIGKQATIDKIKLNL